MTFKTWLESLENSFPPLVVESLLHEAPHVFGFSGTFTGPLALLKGWNADMGFEDIGDNDLRLRLERAFAGHGLLVPDTDLKMRYVYPHATISPADGTESESLPRNWLTYLTVFRMEDETVIFKWVGKNVRPDRFSGLDIRTFLDMQDGWLNPAASGY